MTSLRARYQSGSWVSISVPRRWLLVDMEPQHPSVQLLWDAISSGEAAEDVLDILIAAGVRATPSFVLLWFDARPRAFIKGSGKLIVVGNAASSTHSAEGYSLWVEVEVDGEAAQFTLSGPDSPSGLELPMASGVTVAARVVVSAASAGAGPEPLKAPTGGQPVAQLPGAEPAEPPVKEADISPEVPAAVVEAADVAGEPSYDYLFGATMRPGAAGEVRGAKIDAVQAEQDSAKVAGADFGATAGWHTSSPLGTGTSARAETADTARPTSGPAVRANPQVAAELASSGLIDVVPWLAGGTSMREPLAEDQPPPPIAAPPAPATALHARSAQPSNRPRTAPSAAAQSDLDDAEGTVNRAALLANNSQGVAGPTVLAHRCPVGHLTPPHSVVCRVCHASIAEQQPFGIARPPLGVLRLSTGDTVTLDRGVLIGRKPLAPDSAFERPHLVRVDSPEHDVSRQHAEIVLEGWNVYVRDLGSTNGTTVTLPGQPPQRLREGELQLLEHGAAIILADEIQCVFEVTS